MLRWSSEGHLAPLLLGPSWCSPFRLPPEPLILPGAQHPRALAQHCCPCAPSHHSFASLDRSCRRLSLGQLCSLKSTWAPRTRAVPALPPILREPLPFRRPGTPDPAFPMPRDPLPTPRPSFQITQHSLCSSLPAGICSFGHLRGRGQSGCAGRCPHSNRDSVRGGDSSHCAAWGTRVCLWARGGALEAWPSLCSGPDPSKLSGEMQPWVLWLPLG